MPFDRHHVHADVAQALAHPLSCFQPNDEAAATETTTR